MKHYGTLHILKQVEWYNKLKEKYGCCFVEMEYQEKVNVAKVTIRYGYWKPSSIVYDVYGKTQDGNVFIVEIGHVDEWKLDYLQKMASVSHNKITFFHDKSLIYPNILIL